MPRFTLDDPIYVIENDEIRETTARSYGLKEERQNGPEDQYFMGNSGLEDYPFGVFGWISDGWTLCQAFDSREKAQALIDEWDAQHFFDHAGPAYGINWYETREEAQEWLKEKLLADNN